MEEANEDKLQKEEEVLLKEEGVVDNGKLQKEEEKAAVDKIPKD